MPRVPRIRQKSPQADMRPCKTCMRIRAFVVIAACLIVGLPLAGGNIAAAKVLTPMHFAAIVLLLGAAVVGLKLIEWRRLRAQARTSGAQPVPSRQPADRP